MNTPESATNTPAIGPTLVSTIISRDADSSVSAWCEYLHQQIHSEYLISDNTATQWGVPDLAGEKLVWLANEVGEPWLRIINYPSSIKSKAFEHYGWLSLEISVEDVDSLHEPLNNSGFKIIGEPANLDVSDDIRAMQVEGPDGEVLYLTQVKAAVPPFEIPFARCAVDRLFIPVAMVPDREKALVLFESFEHTKGLLFDTKITVINKALGHAVDLRHPVAAVQLAGENMVELDQINNLNDYPAKRGQLANGIAMISFAVNSLPEQTQAYLIDQGPYVGRRACVISGTAGELLELIETD